VSKRRRLFMTLVLGMVLTLALLRLLDTGTPGTALTQTGTGIFRVATTGTDESDCGSLHSPWRTPQYAVALAGEGDEVRVATGVYTGVQVRDGSRQLLLITKTLTIRGGYNAAFEHTFPLTRPTVLDAEGRGRVVFVAAESPTIEVSGSSEETLRMGYTTQPSGAASTATAVHQSSSTT